MRPLTFQQASPTRGRRGPTLFVGALVVLMLGACAEPDQRNRDIAEEGRTLFSPTGAKADDASWTIVIAAYRGPDRERRAASDLNLVRVQAALADAYVDDRGEATVIAYGRYDDPEDRRAQADLDRIRNFDYQGSRPFSGAILSPPSAAKLGSAPQYDLRNVKSRIGNWVIYSLQIGAYGRIDRAPNAKEIAEFRKAAEQAVIQLRREGEEAFYYHGPTMSSVLVGAWGANDFEPSTDPFSPPRYESPAIKEARREFPYNLFNGQAIRDKGPDGQTRLQPSHLISVPDN